jgi:hypothetical protein
MLLLDPKTSAMNAWLLTVEQRSRGAEEQKRNRGVEQQRSRGAEEQRSRRGAQEHKSRGVEEHRSSCSC